MVTQNTRKVVLIILALSGLLLLGGMPLFKITSETLLFGFFSIRFLIGTIILILTWIIWQDWGKI